MKTKFTFTFLVLLVLWATARTPAAEPARGSRIGSSGPEAVSTPPTNSPAPKTATGSGTTVGFDKLSAYTLQLADDLEFNTNRPSWADNQVNAMIPTNIMAFNNQVISIQGFMIPLEFGNGKVSSFMLSRTPPACCYGTMPQMNEVIEVSVKPPGTVSEEFYVVRVRGTLHVGAVRRGGVLTGVYKMDADSVGGVDGG